MIPLRPDPVLRLDFLEAEARDAIRRKLPMAIIRKPEPLTLEQVAAKVIAAQEAGIVALQTLVGPDGRPLKESNRVHRV